MSSYWKYLNLNPSGEIVSDCSTRTLAFCLNQDYSELKEHQTKISLAISGKKSNWNAYHVFESILFDKDWIKIAFFRKIVRNKLAEMLRKTSVKILTESYGHISPIFKGKIYDTWDCSKGRVFAIMIPRKESKDILPILQKNDVQYVLY